MAILYIIISIVCGVHFISSLMLTDNVVTAATPDRCNSQCTTYACMSNATLCQRNKFLSECGCCHLCVKGNLELCGGPFGRSGVCGKGLRCTVGVNKFLLSANGPYGVCKSIACIRKCKRSAPVCASNGYMFKSVCEMKKFACKGRRKLSIRPLSECINNRHCVGQKGACSFVLQSTPRSNFYSSRRQSYGNCLGLGACSRRYTNRLKCATNQITYLNKCQRNIDGCLRGEKLKWEGSGRCTNEWNEKRERFPLLNLKSFGIIINGTIDPGQLLYSGSDEDRGYSGGSVPGYNSSNPHSLT